MVHFASIDHNDCLPLNLFCGLNNNHACRGTLEIMGNVTVLKNMILFSHFLQKYLCALFMFILFLP